MYSYNIVDTDGNFKFQFRATIHNSVLFVTVADCDTKIVYAGSTKLAESHEDDFMTRINAASADVRISGMLNRGTIQTVIRVWMEFRLSALLGELTRSAEINVTPVYFA